MLNRNYKKIFLYSTFIFSFVVILATNNSKAAWQSPAGNPIGGNDVFPFISNLSGDDNSYIFDLPFGIGDDLIVANYDLFVRNIGSSAGINTNFPQAHLDVNGLIRIQRYRTVILPACSVYDEGSIVYNTDKQRLNICINEAWYDIGYDEDQDAWLDSHDCNDTDPNINPGVLEVCNDSVDDNCDGSLTVGCKICYEDLDGDGYGTPADIIWISQFQSCASGWAGTAGDCNDANPNINPRVDEECLDSIDNDCDGSITNGCTLCFADTDTDGYGNPAITGYVNPGDPCSVISYVSNSTDCDDSDINRNPASEVCGNTVSDDCDALVNEGCTCTSADWTAAPSCPNMSSCTTHQTMYGTKTTDCSGSENQPTRYCECICRADSWNSVSCPECRSAGTRYATMRSGYSCTDTNNTRPSIFCSAAGCPTGTTYGAKSCGSGQTHLNIYQQIGSYYCSTSGTCVYSSNNVHIDTCESQYNSYTCHNGVCTHCRDLCPASCSTCGVSGAGLSCFNC